MATATMERTARREPPEGVAFDPGHTAFWLLRLGFFVAPVLFGLDKFFNWMVDWPEYLWVGFSDFFPGSAQQIMYGVGVLEIAAGLLVLLRPRLGGPVVAAWLAGVVTNLVIVGIAEGEYWDIALRDFGLMMGATVLGLLAWKYEGTRLRFGRR